MPPRSRATAAKILAAVQAVGAGLSQRKASERYDVPKSTLQRALRANAGEGGGAEPEEADRTGPPDHRTGPDRTTPNQTPHHGAEWQAVAAALAGDERLDATDMQAAAMLVAGRPHAEVAEATGMSVRTLSRRKTDPVFQAVVADLRAACHMRARERLARGAEVAIEAFTAGAQLHREINVDALDLMRRFRDGEEGLNLSEVRRAVGLAVESSKMTPQSRALMDAGGFPKTERVELEDKTERDAGNLRGSAAEAAGRLRVIVGGRAESI